jgi:DNA-binding protein H-NS
MPSTKSLKAIERRIKELQAEAAEIRRKEQEGVEQLRAVIEKYKLGPAHFKIAMSAIGSQHSTRARSKPKATPKYRSPDNEAAVWSGRGRRPGWLVAALNDGRTIDEFIVREGQEEPSKTSSAVN